MTEHPNADSPLSCTAAARCGRCVDCYELDCFLAEFRGTPCESEMLDLGLAYFFTEELEYRAFMSGVNRLRAARSARDEAARRGRTRRRRLVEATRAVHRARV